MSHVNILRGSNRTLLFLGVIDYPHFPPPASASLVMAHALILLKMILCVCLLSLYLSRHPMCSSLRFEDTHTNLLYYLGYDLGEKRGLFLQWSFCLSRSICSCILSQNLVNQRWFLEIVNFEGDDPSTGPNPIVAGAYYLINKATNNMMVIISAEASQPTPSIKTWSFIANPSDEFLVRFFPLLSPFPECSRIVSSFSELLLMFNLAL